MLGRQFMDVALETGTQQQRVESKYAPINRVFLTTYILCVSYKCHCEQLNCESISQFVD